MDAMNGTEKSSETDLERAVSPHSLRSARTARSSPNDGAPLKRERSAIEDTAAALAETDPGIEEEKEIDELPNGGYGWVIVVCILALNACTWGVNTTYGVFSAYFLQNDYYGGTQLDYSWVGGLSAAIAVFQGPLANWMVRRFGFKIPLYLGAVCVVLGQCMAGVATNFAGFIICQGLIFGIGMGFVLVPSQPLVAHWFDKRLSLAQGIGQAGSGVGALVFSNLTPVLLHKLGVKWTYVINGCICMALLFPAVFLLKGRHKAVQARSAPLEFKWFWHPGYRWLLLWAFLTMMGYFITIYTLASFCTDALGLSQKQGGAVQSILAAGQIVGRPLWGYLLDRGGRVNMVIISYLIAGVSTLTIWMLGRSFSVMALYGFIAGATNGTIHSASTPLSAAVVGLPDLASALAMYWLTLGVPNLVGQPFGIMLLDYSRDKLGRTGPSAYTISIGFCGGLYLAAAFLLVGAKRYLQGDWKVFKRA
jgi:MFS family permease